MTYLISALFLIEFLLILLWFLQKLFSQGFSFKLGISFGVLYFIFIPLLVMIFTGQIELSYQDWIGRVNLHTVHLKNETGSSFLLICYLFVLILYLYSDGIFKKYHQYSSIEFKPKLKLYFIIYLVTLTIIMLGSGLLEGGNWYTNRHNFFIKAGSFAVILTFVFTSSKLLVITSLILFWNQKKLKLFRFLIYILGFTFFDMIFTGNRIYLFATLIILGLMFLKKYPVKVFLMMPIIFPLVFYVGYFGSIFRHMRGPLFAEGFPTIKVFMESLDYAIELDPPQPVSFLLTISESVNVNVIYDIFNYYDETLYGATYLKTLFFYIPRSIWTSKPESITVITANYFGSTSLVTTIIGELHMNFSYIGLILLPIVLIVTEYILTKFGKESKIFPYIFFIFGLLFLRMPYSDNMIVFMFLISTLYLSKKRFKFFINK